MFVINMYNMGTNEFFGQIEILKKKPLSIWITGLSGAGKSTLAAYVASQLEAHGVQVKILDGDHLRRGLNNNLGFSLADRQENIRRAAEVSKLFNDISVTTINAFICPTEDLRRMAENIVGKEKYFEIYLDVPLEICEQRDPKGLYARFRKGEFKELTGVDSPFEIPGNPHLILKTYQETPKVSANRTLESILGYLCRIKR